ncbi:MAG: aminotransferase class V-fold PLP-dependent enzyme [Gemmatimonadetes bacterium]|jgi:L-seryl-tRNA(Ser) seleniumtransferase|nr:aminotransferase class V-fold PLP-dependent enzyme [Gemmatimonadota bacterium]MBT5587542.1 aminotransferase class V-fold PLP-dependent enzyme [Gemmatimonadota bacterium]MBT5964363.1 aminotransferase class V-fold PLP-dependent enzyme [Gemmatimonadota bacterium]MBT6628708.1 aminotransferase class V-fold PLP-dependent enzyme [Gemmatimonadota bacterium]
MAKGSVYDEIGVRRVINASGSMTYLGGSLIAPEVLAKMDEAAGAFVFIEELLAWASGEIAHLTGTDAGLVTTGSAAGILLSTAACLTGNDRQRMQALPKTDGWKNEVVMQKQHRIGFDHAVGVAGGHIVEVGEVAGTTIDHIKAGLSDKTAAILHVALEPSPTVALEEVANLAHRHGIPVIVDAAAELPPVSNLSAFSEAGGDLVIFSGGKQVSGPNDSGILCGRGDLVEAARLQAFPNGGIGRPLKVGKEQIVGLVFALKRFAAVDWDGEVERWQKMAERMAEILAGASGVLEADVGFPKGGGRPRIIPRTRVKIDETLVGHTVMELDEILEQGTPALAIGAQPRQQTIWLNPQHLEDGEEEIAARHLADVLGRGKSA